MNFRYFRNFICNCNSCRIVILHVVNKYFKTTKTNNNKIVAIRMLIGYGFKETINIVNILKHQSLKISTLSTKTDSHLPCNRPQVSFIESSKLL